MSPVICKVALSFGELVTQVASELPGVAVWDTTLWLRWLERSLRTKAVGRLGDIRRRVTRKQDAFSVDVTGVVLIQERNGVECVALLKSIL